MSPHNGDAGELVAKLREQAERQGSGLLLLAVGRDIEAIMLPGVRDVIHVDARAPDAPGIIAADKASSASAQDLLQVAQRLNQRGVRYRAAGDLETAWACYRIAFAAALRLKELAGLSSISGNLWILRESLRDTLSRGNGPLRSSIGSEAEKARSEALLGDLQRTAAGIREDGRGWLSAAEALATGDQSADSLQTFVVLHRVFDLAEEVQGRRRALMSLCDAAHASGQPLIALVAVLEELASVGLEEILLPLAADADGRTMTADGLGLQGVWEQYVKACACLPQVADLHALAGPGYGAFSQFEHLRLQTTTAGGAFGHRLSFHVSRYLQEVGRTLVHTALAQGDAELALSIVERLRARALTDWMCRTHLVPLTAFAHQFRTVRPSLQGSVGALEPLNARGIAAVAADERAPILIYFRTPTGYAVWLQRPDGQLVTETFPSPDKELDALAAGLPYLRSARDICREVHRPAGSVPSSTRGVMELRDVLSGLHRALLPERIWAALKGQGSRLIIVSDSGLDMIPFSALVAQDGRHLVEDFEIVHWPSVSAVIPLRSTASRFAPSAEARLPALILGAPAFQAPVTVGSDVIQLAPLPGAAEEAHATAGLLHAEELVGEQATRAAVLERATGMSVLHLATHGFLDLENPESCFVALADGVLTSGFLHGYDPGIRCGLVVLSACQTGIGQPHPDSPLSLANAFLIAGANAVCATLWKVDDEVTSMLMRRFYEECLSGQSLSGSLRAAQLDILRRDKLAHPYFWAAFRLTGSTQNPIASGSTPPARRERDSSEPTSEPEPRPVAPA